MSHVMTNVAAPEASLLPVALVKGNPLAEMPKDLYIPPDALEVFLDAFEGPLDLLLYLIKRQNIDILDIPIAEITRQYMVYVDEMKGLRLELAAEYLVMAAMLAEIKSRMLLPRPARADGEEEDPRAEMFSHHHVLLEPLSVRERMSELLSRMSADKFTAFPSLFKPEEGRLGGVVTFLAMLELIKESLIEIVQTEVYGPIYLRAPSHVDEPAAVEEYS